MPTISLEGALANTVIGDLVVILGTIGRFWVLGTQSRTPAKWVSDILFLSFSLLVMGNSVGMYIIYLKELKMKREEGMEAVIKKVVDEKYLQIVYSVGVIYTVQMWCLKGAFLAIFYDMNRYLTRTTKRLLWATIGFVICTFFAVMIYQFVRCQPLNTLWSLDPEKSCSVMLSKAGVIVMSWSNIVSDLAILTIGIQTISSLQIKKKERSALFVVAFVGAVSIVATVVRFVFCYIVARDGAAEFVIVHEIFTWSSIEIVLAFAAFCLPAFRALVIRRKTAKERTDAERSGFMSSLRSKREKQKGEITVLQSFNVESMAMGSETHLNKSTMGYEGAVPGTLANATVGK